MGQRVISRHATREIYDVGFILYKAVIGGIAHVFHPIAALFIVFGENILTLIQIFPDHVYLLGVMAGIDQIVPQREPQILKMDTHRTYFLAVAA